jgi:hypothetical protein
VNPTPARPPAEEIPATSTPFPNNNITGLDNIQQEEGQTESFDTCGVFTDADFINWQQKYFDETVPVIQGETAGIDELVGYNSSNTGGLFW